MTMRKGQAAMEFLMTYGWAILVVLAAIGALAYFGVLSPDRFLPRSCTMQGGFSCDDYKIDAAGEVRLHVINSALGEDATISAINISVNSGGCTGVISPDAGEPTIPFSLSPRNRQQVNFTCTGISGAFSGDITIEYTLAGDSESHIATGSIAGQAEP